VRVGPKSVRCKPVAIYWNDNDILQVLHDCEKRDPGGNLKGLDLAKEVATRRGVAIAQDNYGTFIRELFELGWAELLTWEEQLSPGYVAPPDSNRPNDYLNRIWHVALTVRWTGSRRRANRQGAAPQPG
jgi:hypothetical protein